MDGTMERQIDRSTNKYSDREAWGGAVIDIPRKWCDPRRRNTGREGEGDGEEKVERRMSRGNRKKRRGEKGNWWNMRETGEEEILEKRRRRRIERREEKKTTNWRTGRHTR